MGPRRNALKFFDTDFIKQIDKEFANEFGAEVYDWFLFGGKKPK